MRKAEQIKIRKFKINKLTLNAEDILMIENKTTAYCSVYYPTLHKIL